MSNYTIAVSWSGKDALADSDANKVISGGDFNTEFTTVQTSVNSKADTASPTLTGTPLAPTATVATDTTQVATTAFVKNVLENYIYPVGSIYMNMAVATNPGTLLGFGTWVAYATGQVLVGHEDSGTFDSLNESLGAETAAHTLTVAEMNHFHGIGNGHTNDDQNTTGRSWSGGAQGTSGSHYVAGESGGTPNSGSTLTSGSLGSTNPILNSPDGHSHSTLQPSKTLYIWKRTA